MPTRTFDLNIKEVLENWEIEHALREIISNALDEQTLSDTKEIAFSKDKKGYWHIRDYGRGLRIDHFTLNEDQEKTNSALPVIGKFGVGLKDALATLHRRGAKVLIQSKYGTFRLREVSKYGFDDIITLHVEFDDTPQAISGTEFVLQGVTDVHIAKAKSLFMRFADEKILDATQHGEILRRRPGAARVYILGVLASEEPNFAFSYNVTNLTEAMKKRLNRERLNVGRTTYTDRIKTILKSSKADEVHNELINQVDKRAYGDQSDEMSWIEISQFALNLMHQKDNVAYVTEEELQAQPNLVGVAKSDGLRVVVITEQQKEKVVQQVDSGGPELRTLEVFEREFNQSFQYEFVDPKKLNRQESKIFDFTPLILKLIGTRRIPKVFVSETMRVTSTDTEGVWDPSINAIVIKRTCLNSLEHYAGVLLHEAAHASSGAPDVSRQFEEVLTSYLGLVAAKTLSK